MPTYTQNLLTHLHGSHKIIPLPGQSSERITSQSSELQIHFNASTIINCTEIAQRQINNL